MKSFLKFLICFIVYIVIAFGIYGYSKANKLFICPNGFDQAPFVATFWPITIPIVYIGKFVIFCGDYSISLFTPIKAESN